MKRSLTPFLLSFALLSAFLPLSTGIAAELRLIHKTNTLDKGLIVDHSCSLGAQILFAGDDGRNGFELWSIDHSNLGAVPDFSKSQLLKEFFPGPTGGFLQGCTPFNNKVFFAARDPQHGEALWMSDGTTEGTTLAKDLHVGTREQIFDLVAGDTKLFFFADNANDSLYELWVSDGTEAGTKRIHTFPKKQGILRPHNSYALPNGRLIFTADTEEHGREVWLSDGQSARLAADLAPGSRDSNARGYRLVNGSHIFFQARGEKNGLHIAPLNFESVSHIPNSFYDTFTVPNFTVFKNNVYFRGNNGDEDGIFVTDGTPEGTERIELPISVDQISAIRTANNYLFFLITNDSGKHLFRSDGTKDGTELVKQFSSDNHILLNTNQSAILNNGSMVFMVRVNSRYELWGTTGTSSGTRRISNVRAGGEVKKVISFGNIGEHAIFTAGDTHFLDAHITDGTVAGTTRITFDPTPELSQNSAILPLGVIKNRLLYTGMNSDGNKDYFSYDVVDQQIRRAVPKSFIGEKSSIQFTESLNDPDRSYFSIREEDNTYGLYLTDGSPQQFTKILSSRSHVSSSAIARIGGQTLFSCFINDAYGGELCRTDNTPGGTTTLADINPGPASSSPNGYTVFDETLFFFANDGANRYDVWYSDGTAIGTQEFLDSGESTYNTSYLVATNDDLFIARNNYADKKVLLWSYDGITTKKIFEREARTIAPGAANATEHYFIVEDFEFQDSLIASDGTVDGTREIFQGNSIFSVFTAEGALFFLNRSLTNFITLYRYDIECDRTQEIMTVEGSFATAAHRGEVILLSVLGPNNSRLFYLSDGSAPGTRQLSHYIPSAKSFIADNIHQHIGKEIFILGPDTPNNRALYAFNLNDINWQGLSVKECGCSHTIDSDGDGAFNCYDACPSNPEKIDSEGICGCDLSDQDSNGDKIIDCLFDLCPDNPEKTEPGVCGCGIPDIDQDKDGVPACIDIDDTDPEVGEVPILAAPSKAVVRFKKKKKGKKRIVIKVRFQDIPEGHRIVGEVRLIKRRKKKKPRIITFETETSRRNFRRKSLRRFRFVEVAYSLANADQTSLATTTRKRIPKKLRSVK